ncbi:hypothetical protein FS837_003167 [Tulasnella sp. UAMH 9824]|nr:hypothetical protein FS837_003167 [Tulasnella sp. UAMH 9824]
MDSPPRDDETQSDADGSNETDLESEVQSTSEPPPEAPPRHSVFRALGRCAFTDTDKEFMVKYLAWAERENLSLHYVFFYMAKLMPWHSVGSIRSFVSKNPDLFRKRNIPSRGPLRPLGRASFDYRLQQGTNLTRTPDAEARQSEDPEPEVVTKSTSVKGHTFGRKDQQRQEATSSGTSKAQSAISQTVIDAMEAPRITLDTK